MLRMYNSDPVFSDDDRTVLTGDSGPIDPEYTWEETVDVSADEET